MSLPETTNKEIHDRTIKTMAKAMVLAVLNENCYNITKSTQVLGISRASIYRKMREYGIRRKEQKAKMAHGTTSQVNTRTNNHNL